MFNQDGTVTSACGNGTRCVARLIMAEIGQKEVHINTGAGRLRAWMVGDDPTVIATDMGIPKLNWQDIPLREACDAQNVDLGFEGLKPALCVNMGNPHAVIFCDNVEAVDIAKWGALGEMHPLFPERANIEFVEITGDHTLRMRVWERGVGITSACGSGACAAAVAASKKQLAYSPFEVHLDGGILTIDWAGSDHDPVIMTGPTSLVAKGVFVAE